MNSRRLRNVVMASGLSAAACGSSGVDSGEPSDTVASTTQAVTLSSVFASPTTSCVALGETPDVTCVDTSTSGFSFKPNDNGLFGLANSPLGKVLGQVNSIASAVGQMYGFYNTATSLLKAFGVLGAEDPNAAINSVKTEVDNIGAAIQYNAQDGLRTGRVTVLQDIILQLQGVAQSGVWPVACDSTVAPCLPGQLDQDFWKDVHTWVDQAHDQAGDPAFKRVYVDSLTNGSQVAGFPFTWKTVISYTKADLLPDESGGNVYDWRVPLPTLLELDAMLLTIFASEDPKFLHDRWNKLGPFLGEMHDDLVKHLQILESGLRCNSMPANLLGGLSAGNYFYTQVSCADIFTGLNETQALVCNEGQSYCDAAVVRAATRKAYADVRAQTPWFDVQSMIDKLYLFRNGLSDFASTTRAVTATGATNLCLTTNIGNTTGLSACASAKPWAYDREAGTLTSGGLCLDAQTPDLGQGAALKTCVTHTDPADPLHAVVASPSQRWSYDPEHQVLNSAFGAALEISNVQYTQSGTLVGASSGSNVTMQISADLGGPQGALGPDLVTYAAVDSFPPQKWRTPLAYTVIPATNNWVGLAWLNVARSEFKVMSLTVGWDGGLWARSSEGGRNDDPVAISTPNFAPAGASMAGGRQTTNTLDGFVVGNDGKLYVTTETSGGTWSTPVALSAAGLAPPGAEITTVNQGGQLGAFVVDVNGRIEVAWWNPALGWLGPVAITQANAAPAGARLASGIRANGERDVFYVGGDGALKYMAFNLGIWSGPYVLTPQGFAPPGAAIATALDVHGFLNVFTVGNDGALYTKWDATPLWSGPTALTSTGFLPAGGNVSAINFGNSALDPFVVDEHGAIEMLSNAGLSWAGPTAISRANVAAPGGGTEVTAEGNSQLDLFAASTSGYLVEMTNGGGTWTAPAPME